MASYSLGMMINCVRNSSDYSNMGQTFAADYFCAMRAMFLVLVFRVVIDLPYVAEVQVFTRCVFAGLWEF